MLQSLLAHKRNNNGRAPARHEILQPLLDKMHCEQPTIATVDMPAIKDMPAVDMPAIENDLNKVENDFKDLADLIDVGESSEEDNLMFAIYGGAKQESHVHFAYVPCRVPDVPGDVAHAPQAVQDRPLAACHYYKNPALLPNAFTHFTSLRSHSANTKIAPKNNSMDIELTKPEVSAASTAPSAQLSAAKLAELSSSTQEMGSDAARVCQT